MDWVEVGGANRIFYLENNVKKNMSIEVIEKRPKKSPGPVGYGLKLIIKNIVFETTTMWLRKQDAERRAKYIQDRFNECYN